MSDRLLVSTRKGLFILRASGGAWSIASTSFLGDPVTLSLFDPRDNSLYAALDHGHFGVKLQRSDDNGASWTELEAPKYPEKPDGLSDTDGSGREVPWSTKLIWDLVPGGGDRPGRLWAGTIPGGLFVSDDRGDSWSMIESLWRDERRNQWFGGGADWPGMHSVVVDPRDSDRILAAVSCGGVWESTDAGETWNVRAEGMRAAFMPPERANDPLIQDPHRMVACPADPDVLWVQHHNGIFKSTDGAASWTEIDAESRGLPSTFGFAVAVHPERPDTAWFVPGVADAKRYPVDGKLVVTRTTDGGDSFEILRDGLPQEHAYDIAYRHALAIDGTGDRLAFGTTTGSLFATFDGGDRWEAVSTHLPPIYAVTFA